jgi:ATP-dependent Clp protease ATP-binding subunit ClpA
MAEDSGISRRELLKVTGAAITGAALGGDLAAAASLQNPPPGVTSKTQRPIWMRFTKRARRAIVSARDEAVRLDERYVGTEHFLLALARDSDSVAAQVLERLGVPLERIRSDVERQVGHGHGAQGQEIQLTPRARRVIDLAYWEAWRLENEHIGTEHLLLGLIRERDGLAARVLVKLGADLERTRREVEAMQQTAARPKTPNRGSTVTTTGGDHGQQDHCEAVLRSRKHGQAGTDRRARRREVRGA